MFCDILHIYLLANVSKATNQFGSTKSSLPYKFIHSYFYCFNEVYGHHVSGWLEAKQKRQGQSWPGEMNSWLCVARMKA